MKFLELQKNPILWCMHGLSMHTVHIHKLSMYKVHIVGRMLVYMERTVDKLMYICGRADEKFLNTEASSRSAFYDLRSITKTLVWLHYCLDG
jgi:hypothetical protein